MKVLVTGGCGYIGTILTNKLLKHNFKVKVYDSLVFGARHLIPHFSNPNFELIKGDILDKSSLSNAMNDCNIVINLGAVVFTGGETLSKYVMEVNYEGFKNVVDVFAEQRAGRLIQISTCSNYGVSDKIVTEESPLNPTNIYAKSKIKCEEYLQKQKAIPYTILRMSTVFGLSPRMRFDLTVNDFVMKSFVNKKLEVFNPYAWRPGIHIDDGTEVINLCCSRWWHNEINGIFNIGDTSLNYQKSTLVNLIKERIPELKTTLKKVDKDVRDYQVSFDKMNDIFKIRPKKTLGDGIDEILKALRDGVFLHPYDTYYNNLQTYHTYYHDRVRKDNSDMGHSEVTKEDL